MRNYTGIFLAVMMILTGCAKQENSSPENALPDLDSIIAEGQEEQTEISISSSEEPETEPETETFSAEVVYLTSHQTENPDSLKKFQSHLEQDGFIWSTSEILNIPSDAEMLIYDSPQEDLTTEECKFLENYMDNGGKLLLLLPASEQNVKFNFLEHLLEEFCFILDYDVVTHPETEEIALQALEFPDRMTAYEESMQTEPVYMRNMRSFHISTGYSTDELFIDALLQTPETVKGEPFGGEQDDPVTYENERLNIMAYSRDSLRNNASVVVCGSADFLSDEYFDAETSEAAQNWIYTALYWFDAYSK